MADDIHELLQNSYNDASERELFLGKRKIGQDLIDARRSGADDEHINALKDILKSYEDQLSVISKISDKYTDMNKTVKNVLAENYSFQHSEEEKLAKNKLSTFKSLYTFINDKDRERYAQLDEEEAKIYETALKNNRELYDDEIERIKDIENKRLSGEERVNKHISELQKKSKDELTNIIVNTGLLQSKGEEDLARTRLSEYKQWYNYAVDKDRERYKELDEKESEIYKQALENKRELTKEELKQLKQIDKERSKIDSKGQWTTSLKKTALNIFKDISHQLVSSAFNTLNYYTNVMFFDQAKKGMSDFAQSYEQNFTELAGRMGTNRAETHDIIGSGLSTVNNDSTLSGALNFSGDVMPAIVEATKAGFTGEEAVEVGISKALDKKIMPWLDTNSETWNHLQFNLSDDGLRQIKGQQLLLQETREGNRILQGGIADTLLNQFAPLLASIDVNTTSKEDLGQFYAIAQAQLGDNAPESVIKETAKSMYNAAYKSFDTLQNGSVADKMRVIGYRQTGSITGMEDYLYNSIGRTMENINDPLMLGAYASGMGINLYADRQGVVDQYFTSKEESAAFNVNTDDLGDIYNEAADNAVEKVTATQKHDNEIQNEYAKKILNALETPHGSDIQIQIFQEVQNLKNWLMTTFFANLATSVLDKGLDKLGSKILGKGTTVKGGGGSTTSPAGGVSKGAVAAASITGAITGAAMGISETHQESTEYTNIMMSGKDMAKDSQEYKDFKASLESKHKAKMTGAIAGGIAGGVAGAAGGIWAGAAAGAAVGTVVPGIGNAVGAVVGGAIGLIGGLVGAKLGAAVGDAVSPLTNVLSDAAVESLESLDIMKTNWDEEVFERQNLVSAMKDTTDIEVQKRMLLDAGIDSNLVKMANTDEALDSLANKMLKISEDNAELSNSASGTAIGINNEAARQTFDSLNKIVDKKDSASRRKELKNILSLTNIDSSTKTDIIEKIDDTWWWGTSEADVDKIMALIMASASESDLRAIAGSYDIDYDPMNMQYFNELTNAIQAQDKDAAIEAIKMLKADKLTDGSTSWDKIKNNDQYANYREGITGLGIDINQYRTGSAYIPTDMVAQLHAGERVLTEGQNQQYTEELISGKSTSSIIQSGIQDLIQAIKMQTSDIITYLSTMSFNNPTFNSLSANMSPSMGNTKVTF